MIGPDVVAEIRRLFFAEHFKVGTIASHLGVHHETVKRAIEVDRFASNGRHVPSMLDAYLAFIEETLARYPKLTATRVHEMLVGRGYRGSVVQTRRVVRRLRPEREAEAFLRLETLPGEQGQVDWGSFGHVVVGRGKRALSAFVMVLSSSRALHVLFTLDQTTESFMRGHVEAFEYFGGVPRVLLYDNLKSAVVERYKDAIRFNPKLLELAGHYHFEPRPVAPRKGNEKGKVERQIRFLRDRFFAARRFRDVDDLNDQFRVWRCEWAHARPCPADVTLTVEEALEKERDVLLPLPENALSCDRIEGVSAKKTPYVRFDRNDYSIPSSLVRKPLTLIASPTTIRVVDGAAEVASHTRSYDSGRRIEDPRHIKELVEKKRAARATVAKDRLIFTVPIADAFFEKAVEHSLNIGRLTQQLHLLLDEYGADEMSVALEEALARGTIAFSAIAHILEVKRRRRNAPPTVHVELPDDPRIKNLHVKQHDLRRYDGLADDDHES